MPKTSKNFSMSEFLIFISRQYSIFRLVWSGLMACGLVLALGGPLPVAAQEQEPESAAESAPPAPAEETVTDEREEAAWEYRPYQVLVWIVNDHGAMLEAANPRLLDELDWRCQLADPSGWRVRIENAPAPWSKRLQGTTDFAPWTTDIILSARTAAGPRLDKLIIVQVSENLGLVSTEVQELDLKTELWGPRIEATADVASLGAAVYEGVANAFMPLTRIDRIQELEVLARVRASGIAWVPDEDENGQLVMVPNQGSPVWVRDDEILLPVILRKDRLGNISDITPVEHTYLWIEERSGPHLRCDTIAMQRAPLGGRSGGRTERMALCVRSPNRPTVLQLVSNDKEPEPLRDLKVLSRHPGMEEGVPSEVLGKSDWRGQITVPPHESGLRILLVQSGRRPLAQVPIVPGLHGTLSARMPNDERRLYAEGIVKGYQNELSDLLARRLILGTLIESALARKDLETAEAKLAELRRVEDSKRFNTRLNLEKKNLLQGDERQKGFILQMFDELETLSNQYLDSQRVAELSRMVREAQTSQ